jgi:HD-like signal output (HDOD) protein
MVGGRELSTLAMGVSAVSAFQGVPPELIDMTAFWRHSLSVGLLAKLLATHCGDRAPERFFTAGLLHDVGRLILFKRLPQASVDVLRYARGACVPLVDAEEAVMGFTHARVGGLLLAAWGFPESLEMAARLHHGPVEGEHDFTAMVVHVADNIANALAIAQGSQFALPGAASGAWERLGTPVESLEEICREHDEQLEAIFGAFFG